MVEAAKLAGFDGYFMKPLEGDFLAALMNTTGNGRVPGNHPRTATGLSRIAS